MPTNPTWKLTNLGKNEHGEPAVMTNHQKGKPCATMHLRLVTLSVNLFFHFVNSHSDFLFVHFCKVHPMCQNETLAKFCCMMEHHKHLTFHSINTFLFILNLTKAHLVSQNSFNKHQIFCHLGYSFYGHFFSIHTFLIPITESCPSIIFQNHPT